MASLARCGSAWNSIEERRSALRAISAWIRLGSRSKISTRSASGAWKAMARASTPPHRLPDGTRFEGVRGLRALMASHQEDFVRTFTEKLMSYALGRGIESTDLPAIRRIARDSASQDYRWSAIILGIVTSTPFSMSSAGADIADNGVKVAQGSATAGKGEKLQHDRL